MQLRFLRLPRRWLALLSIFSVTTVLFVSAAAGPAVAALHQYTVQGNLFGGLSSESFFPSGPEPFSEGATFTMTFVLDDAAPIGSSGATFGIYEALSNVEIDFDTGDFFDSSLGDVITTTSGGTNHGWDASVDVFSGTSSGTIPDVDFEDFDGNPAFGFFIGFQFVLFDNTGSMYSQSPPELFAADLTDSTSNFVALNWDVQNEFAQELASIQGEITSISVPEPAFAAALAAGALGIVVAAPRRRKVDRRA